VFSIKFTVRCTHVTGEASFRKWCGLVSLKNAVSVIGSIVHCQGFVSCVQDVVQEIVANI